MSKSVKEFFSKVRKNFDVTKKFTAALSPGSRILPSQTSKNDAEYELRIDAGDLVDGRYRNLNLQVNSQAKNTGLKKWVKKQKRQTHTNLATTRFDTLADDLQAETERALNELEEQARQEI